MRIGTWNLERPSARSWRKGPAQLEQLRAVDADIWVLTETRASVRPSQDHRFGSHAPAHPARRPDPDERWVSIWSRYPLRDAGISPSRRGTVACIADTPLGELVVYGTVVPWAHEPDPDGVVRAWNIHRRELARQAEEWQWLSERFPALCVAGDFNQAWRPGGYGTAQDRRAHHAAADAAGLVCLTADETDGHRPLIDHILLTTSWAARYDAGVAATWSGVRSDGTRMSDHAGVAVDIGGDTPSREG